MATLDEILGGGSHDSRGHAPKGYQERTEQDSGDNTSASSPPTAPPRAGGGGSSAGTSGGYEELYKKLNPYKPPTDEEIAKEKKKQTREQIFAAISDGVTALANLYFTTQYAPNMYNGKNTLSGRNKVRYNKLMKDREEQAKAYFGGLMKARQADEANAHRERSWQRQLGLDQDVRDRYNSEQEYKKGRDKEADRRWKITFDEDKRRSDRQHDYQVKQHNDNIAIRHEQARATAARGVRGKQLGFADGNGNQVSIYENVWKGSMQQVYDAMLADLAPTDETERRRWEREMRRLDTPQKKEDYVKQNWHKSPRASQIMLTLSGIDPATMTSELNNEVVDYVPGGGDDEVIDYIPGKNK